VKGVAKNQRAFRSPYDVFLGKEQQRATGLKGYSQMNFALPVLNAQFNLITLSLMGMLGIFTSFVLAFNTTSGRPPGAAITPSPFYLLQTRRFDNNRAQLASLQSEEALTTVNVMQANSDAFGAWLGAYTGGGAITVESLEAFGFKGSDRMEFITEAAKQSVKVTGAVCDVYRGALGRPFKSHYTFASGQDVTSGTWRKREMYSMFSKRDAWGGPDGRKGPAGKKDTFFLSEGRSLLQADDEDDDMRLRTGAFSQGLELESTELRAFDITVGLRVEGELRCAVMGADDAEPSAAEVFAGIDGAIYDSGLLPRSAGVSIVQASGLKPGTAYVVYCAASVNGSAQSLASLDVETIALPLGFDTGLTPAQEQGIGEEFCSQMDGEVGGAYIRELLCEESPLAPVLDDLDLFCAQPVVGGQAGVTAELCLLAADRLMRGFYVGEPTVDLMTDMEQDMTTQYRTSINTVLALNSVVSRMSIESYSESTVLNGWLFLLVIVGAPSVGLLLICLGLLLTYGLGWFTKTAPPDVPEQSPV
jgi:hypothetical protein